MSLIFLLTAQWTYMVVVFLVSCFPLGAIASPLVCVSTEFAGGKGKEVGVPAPGAFPWWPWKCQDHFQITQWFSSRETLPLFTVSNSNPRLLILLERKPWEVSDWSQLSPAGAALRPFRGVAQPPHAAGSRTQPHRSSLCSGPNRRVTLFSSSPLPPQSLKEMEKTKKTREIHIIIIIIQYFF